MSTVREYKTAKANKLITIDYNAWYCTYQLSMYERITKKLLIPKYIHEGVCYSNCTESYDCCEYDNREPYQKFSDIENKPDGRS